MSKYGNTCKLVLLSGLVFVLAYSAVRGGAAQTASGNTGDTQPRGITDVGDAQAEQTPKDSLVEHLVKIAKDEQRNGEERIEAILRLGQTGSDKALRFLLDHLALRIAKTHFRGDDDEEKQQPCFYALKSMGSKVVPHLLGFLERQRSAEELELVAQLFKRVFGTNTSREILQKKLTAVREQMDNIQQLLSLMPAPKSRPGPQ